MYGSVAHTETPVIVVKRLAPTKKQPERFKAELATNHPKAVRPVIRSSLYESDSDNAAAAVHDLVSSLAEVGGRPWDGDWTIAPYGNHWIAIQA